MKAVLSTHRALGRAGRRLSGNRPFLETLRWLCFLFIAAGARAEYVRPIPSAGNPPTPADLVLYDGASTTLSVQLLNLTPYDIEFTNVPFQSWSIDTTDIEAMKDWEGRENNEKSFMFVPVGVPSFIPAAPDQNFEPPYLDWANTIPNPNYDPTYVDTTTHPYPMLFSWDDRGGFVVDNWIKWTVKNVSYKDCDRTGENCVPAEQDVDIGLWMYRNSPAASFTSGFLPTLSASLNVVFKSLKLITEAANPARWINEFLAIATLVDDSIDFAKENTRENDGHKMWVASYVIPDSDSLCSLKAEEDYDCTPSLMIPTDTGDAVFSLWPALWSGPSPDGEHGPYDAAEARLVVTLHVFRGQRAQQCDPVFYPNKCPLGSEPVVMITVMRDTDFAFGATAARAVAPELWSGNKVAGNKTRLFLLQAGFGKVQQLLKEGGDRGLHGLRSIISELEPAQTQVLVRMIHTMGTGRLPTKEERELVRLIADELKAGLK